MKTKTRSLILFLISNCVIAAKTFAQALPDSTITKINKLFTQWDNGNSPGCAVGVVRNDSILFAKGYGMEKIAKEKHTVLEPITVSTQVTV